MTLNGPFVEYVGYPSDGGVAKTKATGTLRWSFRNWVVAWNAEFFDGYKQYGSPGDPLYRGTFSQSTYNGYAGTGSSGYLLAQGGWNIPSQMYHNLYLSYSFGKNAFEPNSAFGRALNPILTGISVRLNINNVFNTIPPFDAFYSPFYISPYGDYQLRSYQLSVKKAF